MKKKSPKVSIIIPVYNGEKYIKETLDSVLNQTFKDFEVLLIDDASTDNSRKIINKVANSYSKKIRYFRHRKNKGSPAASRNTGIKKARGEYLAFIDQDDLWDKKKLERQIAIIEKNHSIGMVFSNGFIINEKAEVIGKAWDKNTPINPNEVYKKLLNGNFIFSCSVIVRKETLNKVGNFDESLIGTDDYDMWIRIARISKVGIIQEPLSIWRCHSQGMSSDTIIQFREDIKIYNKILKNSRISEEEKELVKKVKSKYLFKLGSEYALKKEFEKAKRYFSMAEGIYRLNLLRNIGFQTFIISPRVFRIFKLCFNRIAKY